MQQAPSSAPKSSLEAMFEQMLANQTQVHSALVERQDKQDAAHTKLLDEVKSNALSQSTHSKMLEMQIKQIAHQVAGLRPEGKFPTQTESPNKG